VLNTLSDYRKDPYSFIPLPGPAGGAYRAPTDSVVGLMVWGPREREERMEPEGEERGGENEKKIMKKRGIK